MYKRQFLGLPLAFGALPIYLFVPDLYARSGLLGLSAIGAVLVLTRLIDAFADPFFGWLIDRSSRKAALYLALVPFAAGFYGLFNPGAYVGVAPAAWLFLSLAACTMGFSAVMIAYQAWGGDLGADTPERLSLTGSREAFILGGVVIASVSPSMIAADPMEGLRHLPWLLFVFLGIALLALRHLPSGQTKSQHDSLPSRLKLVWCDLEFRRLLYVFFANGIASAFPATLFVFYVTDVLQAQAKTGILLGAYFLSAALAVPLWVRCAQRIGRPRTWVLAMLLAICAFLGAAFLGSGDWLWFLLICLISGAAVGTDLTIPASIVADIGEMRGGAGTYFGVWNLVAKLNLALAAGIALPLLAVWGYVPGAGVHNGVLIAAYVLLPIVLKGVAVLLLYRWRKTLSLAA